MTAQSTYSKWNAQEHARKDAEIAQLRAALTKIKEPLLLDTYGTGTQAALNIIVAMREIAKAALVDEQRVTGEGG